jgi:hypothetical protein
MAELRARMPNLADDPELAAAWRSLQLHWLATIPGYRDEIKQRVAVAARRAETISRKIERQYENVDYLGREVDGCG